MPALKHRCQSRHRFPVGAVSDAALNLDAEFQVDELGTSYSNQIHDDHIQSQRRVNSFTIKIRRGSDKPTLLCTPRPADR